MYQATAAQVDPVPDLNQAAPLGSIQVGPLLQCFRRADPVFLVFRQLPSSTVVPVRVLHQPELIVPVLPADIPHRVVLG